MSVRSRRRAVWVVIALSVLCTALLGLMERRGAPLTAASPAVSPLGGSGPVGRGTQTTPQAALGRLSALWARLTGRAFWRRPWPWIGVGLVGFGLLAWGIGRMERHR
jgi:hypothetical protein